MRNHMLLLGRSLIERGAWFFAPFSWIFASIVFLRNKLYDKKWLVSHLVPCPVVSVGNLVAGGTGKTPFVLALSEVFSHRKVAILSRGYGALPDEAMLLQRRLPNAKIYVGKHRTLLAKQAVHEGAELIFLDDGFQHRKLARDLDVVLLSANDPFGKKQFLPYGFLRDDPKRLHQADALFVKDRDFRLALSRICNEKGEELPHIQGWKVGLFCGIANPASFQKMVTSLGAEVVAEWILADHALASPTGLEAFAEKCKSLGAKALVTTEKDFIKGLSKNKMKYFDSARQSPIEGCRSERRSLSPYGKGDEEDRLGKVVASQNALDCFLTVPTHPTASLPILCIEVAIEWTKGKRKWENLVAKIDRKLDHKCN